MPRFSRVFAGAALATSLAVVVAPAVHAQARQPVDLALVLAVDASGSITPDRWDLERQGYAQAFRDPEVLKAIESGPIGAIAVTLVEWSGQLEELQVVPWTVISDTPSADHFAANLVELPRSYRSRTSISGGLLFSAQLLDQAPYQAMRWVIDVSGDGPDNTNSYGYLGSPEDVADLRMRRDQIVAEGITINGLPIFGDPRVANLDDYYQANVIGGPDSFMIVAKSFETFATAIQRKLIEEIADAKRPTNQKVALGLR